MQKTINTSKQVSFNLLSNMIVKYKSFVRFVCVGFINTFVDFSAFIIFNVLFGLDKVVCQFIGYSFGILNSFVMNKVWTFENRTSKFNTVKQFIKFIMVNLLSLVISMIGIKILVDSYHLTLYLSKVVVTAMAQMVNYIGYRFWVFGKAKAIININFNYKK